MICTNCYKLASARTNTQKHVNVITFIVTVYSHFFILFVLGFPAFVALIWSVPLFVPWEFLLYYTCISICCLRVI